MLFTATSAAKWLIARYRGKTATRASTAADMMPSTDGRAITRSAMLVNSLKNGLEIFVFGWSGRILCGDK